MQVATGKSVCGGIAIGKIKFYRPLKPEIDDRLIENIEAEMERFEHARKKAIEQQELLYEKVLRDVDEDSAEVFSVHAGMLEEEDLVEAVRELIRSQKHTAEYAVKVVFDHQAAVFAELKDPYMKERAADIYDIERVVLKALVCKDEQPVADYEHVKVCKDGQPVSGRLHHLSGMDTDPMQESGPCILTAEDLTPSEMVRLDRSMLLGVLIQKGSANSHTAILARAMGIPTLVQCTEVSEDWDGIDAIVDGFHSRAYIEPTEELAQSLKKRREEDLRQKALLKELKGVGDATIDGTQIKVYANISGPLDIEVVQQNDAGGIGLFRSEFVYLNAGDYPTEEEQFDAYRLAVEALAPKPIMIRTCDIGADKQVDYMKREKEENPAMGVRAVRICLTHKDFFKTQLRALLRTSAYGNVGIMFPMIVSIRELRECKELLCECEEELKQSGIAVGNYSLGVMIETPAAVLIADELAEECDFFSIGTNDLTQYTLAMDRQNAGLDSFFDTHHPAVLKLIQMTVEAGHRHGIRVGICGELGADFSLTETFLRMGVDELSVDPASVLSLRKVIRGIDLSQ